MALFSFRHSVKTFSLKRRHGQRLAKLGQTLAHIRYITRDNAAREVMAGRLEGSIAEVAKAAEESALNRKGRVAERFVIALPKEASRAQRKELVRSFSEELTQGRAGYIAAIHDKAGNDLENPHFHLVAFDAHIRTGGRGRPRSVLGFARSKAVEDAAELWANLHNKRMADWGFGPKAMISNLSYEARGIEVLPTIHEGPAGRRLSSASKTMNKVAWRHVDSGHSRSEANDLIRQINILKEGVNNEGGDGLGSSIHRNARLDKEGSRAFATPFGRSSGNAGYTNCSFPTNRSFDTKREPKRTPGNAQFRSTTKSPAASQGGPTALLSARRPPWLRFRPPRRVYADLKFFRDGLLSTAASVTDVQDDQQASNNLRGEEKKSVKEAGPRFPTSSNLAK